MANSYSPYVGDGSTTIFNVTFNYIAKAHVTTTVNNVATAFTWVDDSRIQFVTAPAASTVVRVMRVTPSDAPIVDYVDGSIYGEADLDASALQALYVSQEGADKADVALRLNYTDTIFDARNKRISSIAEPTLASDAATKYYIDTTMSGIKEAALASELAAEESEDAAKESEDAAYVSEGLAEDAKTEATNQVQLATVKANAAQDSYNNTIGLMSVTEGFKNDAISAKQSTYIARDAAALSQTQAANSVGLTNADVVLAEADKVQTGLDRIATAADVVITNADVVVTNADVVLTNADVVLTNADVLLTHADVEATADKLPKSGGTLTGNISNASTGFLQISQGTTAQRPSSPANGQLRYNSSDSAFEGYTAAGWGGIGGGATGGGGDDIFIENSTDVTTDYTLTANKNASSTGPISIGAGITVTVPTGARWVIL